MRSTLSRPLACGVLFLLALVPLLALNVAEAADTPGITAGDQEAPGGDMKVESDRPPSPPPPKAAKPKARSSGKGKREPVWVVFFFAKDCQRCSAVKLLLRGLKDKKLLRLKVFDIDREKDYSLYRSLEAIHGDGTFAVPMVMVGDSILVGEIEIEEKLEGIVKRLRESGKGDLPYLGPPQGVKKRPAQKKRGSCPCEDKGRPPTARQEWNKLRTAVGNWFDKGPL